MVVCRKNRFTFNFVISFVFTLLCHAPLPVLGQFVKHIDEEGNVSYTEDPSYDYANDEPTEENRRLNEAHLRFLREFDRYPTAGRKFKSSSPNRTIRSGRAVCVNSLSVKSMRLGCK